jgi:hypothetical protein
MTRASSRASIFLMNARMPLALLLTIPLLGISAVRAAGAPYVGPYAGGDVLMARLHPARADVHDFTARNDRDLGWKGLVGVRMSPHFAFEAGFTDFGEVTALPAVAGGPSRARIRAFTAFAVGIVPVGPLDAFVKAGPTRLQSTGHAGGAYFDEQQRRITAGAGLQLTKRRLVLRLEYEKYGSAMAADLDTISMGFRLSLRPG